MGQHLYHQLIWRSWVQIPRVLVFFYLFPSLLHLVSRSGHSWKCISTNEVKKIFLKINALVVPVANKVNNLGMTCIKCSRLFTKFMGHERSQILATAREEDCETSNRKDSGSNPTRSLAFYRLLSLWQDRI